MQSTITTILSSELSNAIFNTLLHSLWQIPVIALCIKLVVRRKVPETSRAIYNTNLSAIVISIATAVFTFIFYLMKGTDMIRGSTFATEGSDLGVIVSETLPTAISPGHLLSWSDAVNQYDGYIVLLWCIGALVLMSRMIAGWIGLRYIKREITYKLPNHLTTSFYNIKNRLQAPAHVRLALSKSISVPMVIGHLKPVILIPLATVNRLSIEEIEAILAHELTHILQYDYVKNIIVMIGESLFFYHPVIWMLSSEIREERENICDDTVMKLYPNRIQYAKTLVKLEELYHGKSTGLSLALFTSKFKLMKRVKRILNMQHDTNNTKARIAIIALLMCSLIVFSSANLIINGGAEDSVDPDILLEVETIEPIEKIISQLAVVDKDASHDVAEPLRSSKNIVLDIPTVLHGALTPLPHSFSQIFEGRDTLDDEEKDELRRELREKRSEMREKTREIRERMAESRAKIKSEYKKELKQKRKELKKLRKKLYKDGKYKSYNGKIEIDFDDEDWSEDWSKWGDRMSEWGERLGEDMAALFDEDFADDMAEWGERFGERFGEDFRAEFGERWADQFADIGDDLSAVFDEEWLEGLADMSAEISETFDEEWLEGLEDMNDDIAEALEDAFDHLDEDDFTIRRNDSRDTKTKRRLILALSEDQLLDDGYNTITITNDEMTVNGQTQSSEVLERYQRLIKRSNRNAFSNGQTMVNFSIDGDSLEDAESTSLSISVNY